ncbi:MAG: agmatine deiminase family protein [Verrucomicrobiota bacterium]|nr:agmatine deiminase family protein [Verrucomicrobiota bacterium]
MTAKLHPSKVTPASLGYSMPAEWEPHQATWLSWPRPDGISFPDKFDPIPAYWVRMCRELIKGEEVHVNTFDDTHEESIWGFLRADKLSFTDSTGKTHGSHPRIFLHRFPAYEPWCRDHGPIFVKNPDSPDPIAVVDWGYNAWGGKYPPFDLDDDVPSKVADLLGLPLFKNPTVMEGGSIEVNGMGTLMTTTSCLLNKNRNPHLSQAQIEKQLKDYLGVKHILWLGDGIAGDDTDGHIDDISRFVSANTIVTAVEYDPADENFQPLMANYEKLLTTHDQDGNPFRVISLPMPPKLEHDGQRLPASYANFYIGNEAVLVPIYGCDYDIEVLITLQELFPTRRVVGIDCTNLIWGLGAFHCVTQQQPKA